MGSLAQALMKDSDFTLDLCRFAEGLVTESAVRKRWRLGEEEWVALNDDEFVRAVDELRTDRIRSGAYKRERAQQLIAEKGCSTLDKILSNDRSNDRHKIDAVKVLDGLAEGGPRAVHDDVDRVSVTINLGGGEVYHYGGSVKPVPGNDGWRDGKVIDAVPKQIAAERPMEEAEVIPPRRGPGRPKGSRNKPKSSDEAKLIEQPGLPGFDV